MGKKGYSSQHEKDISFTDWVEFCRTATFGEDQYWRSDRGLWFRVQCFRGGDGWRLWIVGVRPDRPFAAYYTDFKNEDLDLAIAEGLLALDELQRQDDP